MGFQVNLPGWRRAVNCLCGVETQKANQNTNTSRPVIDPQQEAIKASEFIKEDPTWSKYVLSLICVIANVYFLTANHLIIYILY